MNLLGLRYFIKAAETLNFSKAAKELHISQPGLSQQMNTLENELGMKLFDRNTKKVSLTKEGEYLYQKLLPSFENIEKTIKELMDHQSIPQTLIRLSTVPSAASNWLPFLIKSLHKKYPNVKIHVQETTSSQAIEDVKQQKSHMAFIRTPIDISLITDQGLKWLELSKHPLKLVVYSNHYLAECDSVDITLLKDEPFLHYDRIQAPALYFLLERACLTAGFLPRTICAGTEILTIENMIENELGITLMPEDMVRLLKSQHVKAIPLTDQTFTSSISVIWQDSQFLPAKVRSILSMLENKEIGSPYNSNL
ncbi:LysR family transcriptional regulator [Ammoniphilus sp. CFH 90114]|uniref:LysR family transcriptional regulator n=1 Tax=Ammoniphilus sp. CFH 90114 TaxID=2493665 RepID=UPI00100E8B0A|nr:LysR family transcriptional regulator [Ammoniphilus sp. CFH 90114]RXT04324.1 LysR family transcriptional regulator [Ammoniphilus sp. CFH 90114]